MKVALDAGLYDAVIFDLDGVITDTASVHAAAWRNLFDDYLVRRPESDTEDHSPFTDSDYRRYVDGKPRYDGVAAFLDSRGVTLPWGQPSDSEDTETVCGLGNLKNRYFQDRLEREGVTVFESTVALVRQLQDAGLGTAVFSSSRNCKPVLDAAGLGDLFPVRVDGVVAQELGLPGKPDPAVLLESTGRLDATPAHTAVVEDAEAGVAAGRRGGFALVIGVDRTGHADGLRQHGADVVVSDLVEVEVRPRDRRLSGIPSAQASWNALARILRDRTPAVFLDFDGTLSEIVPDPSGAALADGMGDVLERLAQYCPVAVVSGRDLRDVRDRTGLPGLWYAGSHGFEIAGPDGQHHEHGAADEARPSLEQAAETLRERLSGVPGALVEDKRFAVAVHHRTVPPERVEEVITAVREVGKHADHLRVTTGRKVTELRPAVDWDKGAALWWLLEQVTGGRQALPVYAGDDLTDEDALEAIRPYGLGIVVRGGQEQDRRSAAHVAVDGPAELRDVLARLADLLAGRKESST